MRNFLLAAAAVLCFSAPSTAADLIIPETLQPMIGSPEFDWNGVYAGLSAGAQGVRIFAPGEGTLEGTGAIASVFAGLNVQSGSFVYGAEADFGYSGYQGSRPCGNVAWSCAGYVNAQGSARVRVGLAFDSILLYGTAGVAAANIGGSTTSPAGVAFRDSSVRFGWTVGAGADVAFNESLFGRLEYRYTDFGARNMSFDIVYPGVQVSAHTVTAGIGYKF